VSVGTSNYPRDGSLPEDVIYAATVRMKRDRELRQQAGGPAE
jgi:hypothetical protein